MIFTTKFFGSAKTVKIEKEYKYDDHTINASNWVVRFSHRNRYKKSLNYVKKEYYRLLQTEYSFVKTLDYGCGTGVFVSLLNKQFPNVAVGYEPIMKQKHEGNLPIYNELNKLFLLSPFEIITIFEVLEHLQWTEINDILEISKKLLSPKGVLIISLPIEIGPAVLFKELYRYRRKKIWRYGFLELIKTVFLGRKAIRDDPNSPFMDHKGFDFRELIVLLQKKDWNPKILGYGPLPIKHWFCNSQVFICVRL